MVIYYILNPYCLKYIYLCIDEFNQTTFWYFIHQRIKFICNIMFGNMCLQRFFFIPSWYFGHYFVAIKEQKMPKDNILVLNHFLIALFWCYKVHAFFAPFFVGIFNWTIRTILVLKRQPLFRTIFCLNQQSTQFTHMSFHYLRLG